MPYALLVVLAVFLFSYRHTYALEIQDMRFGQHGSSVRAVLDMDNEADFRAMVQDNPARIVIDTPMLSGKPTIRRSTLPPLISDVRLEPLDGSRSRITFMLGGKAIIRSAFMMPAQGPQHARLVVDMAPVTAEVFAKQVGTPFGTLTTDADKKDEKQQPAKLPFASIGGTKLDPIGIKAPTAPAAPAVEKPKSPDDMPLVVIDAGHGGQDPGATQSGVQEKDVTLAIAKDLRRALESTGRYRVHLTRDKDVFIRLPERVRIARREGADVFVSIHADSAPDAGRAAKGASIYTLSDRASDAQAASLAARENKADLLAGVDLPTDDREVADILIDLAMRETTVQSKYFAGRLVKSFTENAIPLLDAPHKQAAFVVLKAPDIPSVLIEVGFLSNPDEAKKLVDEKYRTNLAASIAKGIDTWFKTRKH